MTAGRSGRPPDTATSVRRALDEMGLSPSKRLGQNFLVDANLADAIVRDAAVEPGEVILEVGPGLGALTARLLALGNDVLAVELDGRLADRLAGELGGGPALTVVQGDALASKHALSGDLLRELERLTQAHRRPYSLVANLPYAVSVPVILELLVLPEPPRLLTVTVQLEVAQRLVAAPGGHDYGAASVVAQAHAETRILRRVPPTVFHPRPRVESAVLQCRPRPPAERPPADLGLGAVLQACFQRRRRQLRSPLRALAPDVDPARIASELALDLASRPEDLPVEAFVALARWLARERANGRFP